MVQHHSETWRQLIFSKAYAKINNYLIINYILILNVKYLIDWH
jgi:hypothetical protein